MYKFTVLLFLREIQARADCFEVKSKNFLSALFLKTMFDADVHFYSRGLNCNVQTQVQHSVTWCTRMFTLRCASAMALIASPICNVWWSNQSTSAPAATQHQISATVTSRRISALKHQFIPVFSFSLNGRHRQDKKRDLAEKPRDAHCNLEIFVHAQNTEMLSASGHKCRKIIIMYSIVNSLHVLSRPMTYTVSQRKSPPLNSL